MARDFPEEAWQLIGSPRKWSFFTVNSEVCQTTSPWVPDTSSCAIVRDTLASPRSSFRVRPYSDQFADPGSVRLEARPAMKGQPPPPPPPRPPHSGGSVLACQLKFGIAPNRLLERGARSAAFVGYQGSCEMMAQCAKNCPKTRSDLHAGTLAFSRTRSANLMRPC